MSTASVRRVHHLVQLQRWDEAVSELQPLLGDTGDEEPWCLLAQCRLGLGQPEQARDAARRAAAIAPQCEWAHRLLSVAELQCGRRKEALAAAERSVALEPHLPEAAFTLVNALVANKRVLAAREAADATVVANPNRAIAFKAAAEAATAQRAWTIVESFARSGLALEPHDADLMLYLGRSLQAQGRRAEAAELYVAADLTDPRGGRGRRALGDIHLRPATGVGIAVAVVIGVGQVNRLVTEGDVDDIAKVLAVLRDPTALMNWVAVVLASIVLVGVLHGVVSEIRYHRSLRTIEVGRRSVPRRRRRTVRAVWCAVQGALGLVLGALVVALGQPSLLSVTVVPAVLCLGLAALLHPRGLRLRAFGSA